MFEVAPEVLQAAKKRLVELNSKWGNGLCKGETVDLFGGRLVAGWEACHAWVSSSFETLGRDKEFLTLNCFNTEKSYCDKESQQAFALWMARESMYSKYVLNRGDTESLLTGGQILLCDGKHGMNKTEALWFCKAMRHCVEGSRCIDAWKVMYDAGVDPLLALAFSEHVASFDGAHFGNHSIPTHGQIFYRNGEENMRKILLRDPYRKSTDTYAMFGSAHKPIGVYEKVKSFCSPVLKADGWGGIVPISATTKERLAEQALALEDEIRKAVKVPRTQEFPSSSTVYLEVDI